MLSQEQRQTVFQATDSNKNTLLKQLKAMHMQREEQYNDDKAKGRFLPAAVWKQQGFVFPEGYETTWPQTHKEWHEQLQVWTYCVELHEIEKGKREADVKDQTLDSTFKKQKYKIDKAGTIKRSTASEPLSSTDSETSSDDSSSSHGDPKRRKQKGKKREARNKAAAKKKILKLQRKEKERAANSADKDKKRSKREKAKAKKTEAAEATALKMEQAIEAGNEKTQARANTIHAKTSDAIVTAQALKDNPLYNTVGEAMKAKFEKHFDIITMIKNDAAKVKVSPSRYHLLAEYVEMQAITKALGLLKTETVMLSGVMKALSKSLGINE